jgi:hypothetical protein
VDGVVSSDLLDAEGRFFYQPQLKASRIRHDDFLSR